jgi:ribosomal protein S18 acetylase RimI-like enzyme
VAGPRLRDLAPSEVGAAEDLLDATLGGRHQVRMGEAVDVLRGHGIGAWEDGGLVGVVAWDVAAPRAELTALAVHPSHRGRGVGAGLVEALAAAATARGAHTLWLVTTNDNLDALRLYQRHAFRLTALRPGAVDEARRRLKPTIPEVGAHGIPLRDELVLERALAGGR